MGVWAEQDPAVHPSRHLHDCGIVCRARRPYFLCVMTAGEECEQMAKSIEAVSWFVYEAVDRPVGGKGAGTP